MTIVFWPVLRGDDLAAGVHRQAALVVDDLVPHAQAALFGLAEVVGIENARDAVLEVDRNAAVVRVAGSGQVGRVDYGEFGSPPVRSK